MRLLSSIVIISILLLSSSFVMAQETIYIDNYDDFSRHIPEFNAVLEREPFLLPATIQRVVTNEDVAVHVNTDEGYIESFVFKIYQNYLTEIKSGPQPTSLYIEVDEETITEMINDPELFYEYYKSGKLEVKSTHSLKKAKLFIFRKLAKWFG